MKTNKIFRATIGGGGAVIPDAAKELLRLTPGAKALIITHPNGGKSVRVFQSPDPADNIPPDWTHEDFAS